VLGSTFKKTILKDNYLGFECINSIAGYKKAIPFISMR
jgi:hypothetical protein